MPDPCGDCNLACRACQQKFEKWQRLIDEIRHEVSWLVHDDAVFRETIETMK